MEKSLIRPILLLLILLPLCASAQPSSSPEEIVRRYAAAWNQGDLDAFLAVQSPNIKKYIRRNEDAEFKLGTTSREEVREKYQPLFAKTPRVQVEIVSLTGLGDLIVSRDTVSGFPDGHVSHELTMYEVRDGLIQTIWYLERIED